MHSDLKIIDPVWTTAYIVRNHGYLIYDTLFSIDGNLQVKPQMVDKWTVSDDKLTWTFTLRDGLEWHDGTPVTSEDVVPSLKRWAVRDPLGQVLWTKVSEIKAVDPKTFQIQLKAPTGIMLEALGKPSSQRALHHAQARGRDRSLQAVRGYDRLGALHLREERMEARRKDGLRQESQVQAAAASPRRPWPAARSPRSTASNGWRCPISRRR